MEVIRQNSAAFDSTVVTTTDATPTTLFTRADMPWTGMALLDLTVMGESAGGYFVTFRRQITFALTNDTVNPAAVTGLYSSSPDYADIALNGTELTIVVGNTPASFTVGVIGLAATTINWGFDFTFTVWKDL